MLLVLKQNSNKRYLEHSKKEDKASSQLKKENVFKNLLFHFLKILNK
jgi:hypothetical protein